MEVFQQASPPSMTHPLDGHQQKTKDLDTNNNHPIANMKDITQEESVALGKASEIDITTVGTKKAIKTTLEDNHTQCDKEIEADSDASEREFLMRFWDESEEISKSSEQCKMSQKTSKDKGEKLDIQMNSSSVGGVNSVQSAQIDSFSAEDSFSSMFDLSRDLELALKRSAQPKDNVKETEDGYDGDDDDDTASVASGTSIYVKSDHESEGGWVTDHDIDDLESNLGSGTSSETDFAEYVPKEVQVSSYPSPEYFRKRRSGYTSSHSLSFSSTSDEDDIDGDPLMRTGMITGMAVPSGKTHAFPKVFLRDIEEVRDIWEMDFQVNDQIVPSMESWERLRIVPSRLGAPDDYNRYMAYKILYSKWTECGCNLEWWYSRYLGMTLDDILNTRFERVKNYAAEPELAETHIVPELQAEYTMHELLKLKMDTHNTYWDHVPRLSSSGSDKEDNLTSSEWCDSMDSTMTLTHIANESEQLDDLPSEQSCDIDTEFDVTDVTKFSHGCSLRQENLGERKKSLPYSLTTSEPMTKRQRSQSISHFSKRTNNQQSNVVRSQNSHGPFQRQMSHSGVIHTKS